MGAKNMSKGMKLSVEECKQILDTFYKNFPKIKQFTEDNLKFMNEHGYVEDYMGRRRHLDDALLPEIEVVQEKQIKTNADEFIDISDKESVVSIPDEETVREWTEKWNNRDKRNSFRAREQFKEEAERNGISLKYNDIRIGKTRTQCTNARIQGSAATLTKKAMGKIFNDKEINELGFRLLIPVHDELLGECPIENAERVSQRLSELMIEAAKPELDIKFKCDPYVAKHWYADEVENEIRKEYKDYTTKSKKNQNTLSHEEAIKRIIEDYSEISESVIEKMIDGTYDPLSEEI